MTQTERIAYYEDLLNRVSDAAKKLEAALAEFDAAQPLAAELDAYYGSEDWFSDLEADEAGLLPANLPRGVLSQDSAYDALTDNHALLIRMLETVTEALRG